MVATMDARGRKLVPCGFIYDALQLLRMGIPQLEAKLGCEPGTVERHLRQGMCPNEFALAINGLCAEAKLTRNGVGGYTAKKDQQLVLCTIPSGHAGMLGMMVQHLGGQVNLEPFGK